MAMKEPTGPVLLRGVVYKEGDHWIALCFDIYHAGHADNPRTAIKECVECILIDVEFAIEHNSWDHLKAMPVEEKLRCLALVSQSGKRYRPKRVRLRAPSAKGRPSWVDGVTRFDRVPAMAAG